MNRQDNEKCGWPLYLASVHRNHSVTRPLRVGFGRPYPTGVGHEEMFARDFALSLRRRLSPVKRPFDGRRRTFLDRALPTFTCRRSWVRQSWLSCRSRRDGGWARLHRRCLRVPNRFGHVRAGGAAWSHATSPTRPPPANRVTVANMSCHFHGQALEENLPKEYPCAAYTKCRSTQLGRQRTDADRPWANALKHWNQRLKSRPQLVADFSSCHARHDTSAPRRHQSNGVQVS